MNSKVLVKLCIVLLFLLGAVMSIRQLTEPDLWWQLKAGDLIRRNGIIYTDPFSFTFPGTPWVNIKWGYEMLLSWFAALFPVDLLPLLQVLTTCLLLFVLLRTTRALTPSFSDIRLGGLFILLAFLLASAYRFSARPEMISHLLTATFLLVLTAQLQKPSFRIWWCVPLQLLWANMHDAYPIGLVLVGLFAFTTQVTPAKIAWKLNPWLVFVACLGATVLNPNGVALLYKAFQIFGQVQDTKYTTEFLDYTDYRYWTLPAWFTLALLLLALGGLLFPLIRDRKPFRLTTLTADAGLLFQLLLLIAFVILAMQAYRNLIFLSIVSAPMAARFAQQTTDRLRSSVVPVLSVLLLLAMGSVYRITANNQYYRWSGSSATAGFGIPVGMNPVATAHFLGNQKQDGQTFADYRSSAYLLYRLYDHGFRSYIDLRDLEVFPERHFDHYASLILDPEAFRHELDSLQIHTVVLLNGEHAALHRFLYHDSLYHLVHADPVCAVYQKKQAPPEFVSGDTEPHESTAAALLNTLLFPFKATPETPPFKAVYHLLVNDLPKALQEIKQLEPAAQHRLLGEYYWSRFVEDTAESRNSWVDSAYHYYTLAIKNESDADALLGMGVIDHARQQYKTCTKHLEQAVALNPDLLRAHLFLADAYEKMAETGNAKANYEKEIEHLHEAERLNPDNPFIQTDLGFIYFKLDECNRALPYLEKIKDFKGLSPEDREQAAHYIEHCGK